jgi:hypothetical protein
MSRTAKLSLISLVLTCMLMPLILVAAQLVRQRWEMRNPVERSIHVADIASGISGVEVISVFLLLFAASYLFSRRLLG